jgi:hypothetical protein
LRALLDPLRPEEEPHRHRAGQPPRDGALFYRIGKAISEDKSSRRHGPGKGARPATKVLYGNQSVKGRIVKKFFSIAALLRLFAAAALFAGPPAAGRVRRSLSPAPRCRPTP